MYNDNGLIITVRSGNLSGVTADAEASDENYVITDQDVDLDSYYVRVATKELVAYPPKPSESHTFNFISEAWEFNLENMKQATWFMIKLSRDIEEYSTFSWNGYLFDANERSQQRIMTTVQKAQLDTTLNVTWTLSDNSTQSFNATELKQIGQALSVHVNTCHTKARELRAQIEAATTESELNAITWS